MTEFARETLLVGIQLDGGLGFVFFPPRPSATPVPSSLYASLLKSLWGRRYPLPLDTETRSDTFTKLGWTGKRRRGREEGKRHEGRRRERKEEGGKGEEILRERRKLL